MKKILSLITSVVSLILLTAMCFTCLAVSAPKSVSSVTYTSTSTSITLSWNNVKATGYRVFRYNTSSKKWTGVATTSSTKVTVKKLKPGTKAIYAVRAYNKQGDNIAWAKSLAKITAGTRPKNVTGLKASSKATSVTLSWSKAAGATGYRIYKYNPSAKKWDIQLKATNKTSATIKELSSGKNYIFAVKPYYNSGKGILWASKYTQIKTTTLPAKVKGVKINVTESGIGTITWNKTSGAQKYYVYSYNTSTKKYSLVGKTNKTNFTVENLNTARRYYYAVRAARFLDSEAYSGSLSSLAKSPLTVYRNFMRNNSKYTHFYVLDINKDGIYELIVNQNNSFSADVYTYKNSKVTHLGSFNCYNSEFYYNSTYNAIGGMTLGNNMFITNNLYTIVDSNLKEIAHCSVAHGYDPYTYKDKTTYTIDNYYNEVSKSRYDKYYNTYFAKAKTYTLKQVTTSNISSYA